MRRLVAGTLACGALMIGGFTGSAAAVDENAPHGGFSSHAHHVHTGSGCVDIDSVRFEHDTRGLHQGSNSSGAPGPGHGTCAAHSNHP